MKDKIKNELKQTIPAELVDELFNKYDLLKNRFLSGYFDRTNFEPAELNGGKFSEIVFRILQHLTTNPAVYTPLDAEVRFNDQTMAQFEHATDVPDSIRIHIPRIIRAMHDVRNRRGVAHVSKQISPNLMDSTLVTSNADWVLAELIRFYANQSPEDAQEIVDSIVEKKIPLLWELDGLPVILDAKMEKQHSLLVFLYRKGSEGANIEEINIFLTGKLAKVKGFLTQLIRKVYIVKSPNTGKYVISPSGAAFVEKNIPLSLNIN